MARIFLAMLKSALNFLDLKMARCLRRAPRTLPVLLLRVTDVCNLECRMCGDRWHRQVSGSRKQLSLDEWRGVIASARQLKCVVISLTGGEALLHGDIFRILEFIRKNGISSHLCTNGTLLDGDVVAKLAEAVPASVSVSLDSDESTLHNHLRGADCFDRVVEGIRRLRNAIPSTEININFLLCRLNYLKMGRMLRLAKEIGANQVSFAPIHTNLQHRHRPPGGIADLLFLPADLPSLDRELKGLSAVADATGIRVSSSDFIHGIPRFVAGATNRHTCYAGYVSCVVDPWGGVSPCADIDGVQNVRDLPLEEIWRSPAFNDLRRGVDTCHCSCWDTTNAELALRCSVLSAVKNLPRLLREFRRYRGGRR
jgi:MoaA/NifB/PqqE/SkfB family radical SAM enzyme